MAKPSKKTLIVGFVSVLLLASFLLSRSFRETIQRRRHLRQVKAEAAILDQKIRAIKLQLARLEKNNGEYETLVRKELGYLKPGEREIRFSKE